MAIIKVAKGGKTLKGLIYYAAKEDKTIGKDISDNKEQAYKEMIVTKEIYNKTEGRQYKHYIQSFAYGEVDVNKAQKIALELAEKKFKGYEVFIGTHTDRQHIHNHFVVNSVNFETGKKFNVPKSFLDELKKSNDEICKSYGLEIVKPKLKKELNGEVRAYDMEKYQVLKQAFEKNKKSYVLDTAIAVKNSLSLSSDKKEFIKNMNLQGYKVIWTDKRKHITFTDEEGHKVRLSNLEKTFNDKTFSKGELENEFKRIAERKREFNGEREIRDVKSTIEVGVRKQSIEGVFDRVRGTIRKIDTELKQYSPSGRESIKNSDERMSEVEEIKRDIERPIQSKSKSISYRLKR